jgi:putative component of membrane protein insertase Oxa1/YidC/SpoIIIJ protein YidD
VNQGPRGDWLTKKNRGSKISCYCPFNPNYIYIRQDIIKIIVWTLAETTGRIETGWIPEWGPKNSVDSKLFVSDWKFLKKFFKWLTVSQILQCGYKSICDSYKWMWLNITMFIETVCVKLYRILQCRMKIFSKWPEITVDLKLFVSGWMLAQITVDLNCS